MALSEKYLKEAYLIAKKNLPGWCYAAIVSEARARAGGKAARKPRENAEIEKGSDGERVMELDETVTIEHSDKDVIVPFQKASEEKKIVYGVVMDPYGVNGAMADAHGDWPTPAMIEKTAHEFLQTDMTIGLQHKGAAEAFLVESSIEQYPTTKDYENAMLDLPHQVSRRKFGDDVVHSGSWIIGVQLGDREWNLYKKGELTAFSPGGLAVKRSITEAMLPEVEFIDA